MCSSSNLIVSTTSGSKFKEVVKSHPVRQIDPPLLRDKLQHTRMSPSTLCPVLKLKQHRIRNMQSCKFIQRRRRHDDLSTIVYVLSLVPRHHNYWIAAEVLIVAAGRAGAAAAPTIGDTAIVFIVEVTTELLVPLLISTQRAIRGELRGMRGGGVTHHSLYSCRG